MKEIIDALTDGIWTFGTYITIAGTILFLAGLADKTCLFSGLGIMLLSPFITFIYVFIKTIMEEIEKSRNEND